MLLVSGATRTVARINDPRLGVLLRPGNGNLPNGKPWGVDNGAFSGFDALAFRRLLTRLVGVPGCLWVVVPDVVADHRATRALFEQWAVELSAWPLAFVAQDGCDPSGVPWEHIACVFIGGSTDWKLGRASRLVCEEAKRRGKWLHIGRINRLGRLRRAFQLGADSIDGTMFSRWPDTHIPRTLRAIDALSRQGTLFS